MNTKKKVLYYGFNDIPKLKIISKLYADYNWMPIYISGNKVNRIEKEISDINKKCIVQDAIKLRLGKINYDRLGSRKPIDARILRSLSPYALNYMGLLVDATGWNFSYEERKRNYYEILSYWNTVINNNEPELIVFFTWPHTSACYPLYLLAKHYHNIHLLFIDPVPLLNMNYHFIGNTLENIHEPISAIYNKLDHVAVSEGAKKYLEHIRGEKPKIPQHIQKVYSVDSKTKKKYLKRLVTSVKKGLFQTDSQDLIDIKKNKKSYKTDASRMNSIEYSLFKIKTRNKNIKLRKTYESFCVVPDFNAKYIYFAAPYQPEAVTSILGSAYEDVLLTLELLTSAIPEDWVIYYKEHPGIFLEHFQGSLKRNEEFYKQVDSYSNIKIIPYAFDTFSLIDNSVFVSTIGGTVAWEAAIRNKPAISFGNAWHHGCNSIFSVVTQDDLHDAIKEIQSGFVPDQSDIEKYISAIETIAIKEPVHYRFNEKIKTVDVESEMNRLAVALKQAYLTFYDTHTCIED